MKTLPEEQPTPLSLPGMPNAQTGWPGSPPPVFTAFTPNGSAQFNAGTPNFHYCDRD